MHPALFVIIGFMGPLCLVGLVGVIYGLFFYKKNDPEQSEQATNN